MSQNLTQLSGAQNKRASDFSGESRANNVCWTKCLTQPGLFDVTYKRKLLHCHKICDRTIKCSVFPNLGDFWTQNFACVIEKTRISFIDVCLYSHGKTDVSVQQFHTALFVKSYGNRWTREGRRRLRPPPDLCQYIGTWFLVSYIFLFKYSHENCKKKFNTNFLINFENSFYRKTNVKILFSIICEQVLTITL